MYAQALGTTFHRDPGTTTNVKPIFCSFPWHGFLLRFTLAMPMEYTKYLGLTPFASPFAFTH